MKTLYKASTYKKKDVVARYVSNMFWRNENTFRIFYVNDKSQTLMEQQATEKDIPKNVADEARRIARHFPNQVEWPL